MRTRVRVERHVRRAVHPSAANVRFQVELRPRLRAAHGQVRVQDAVWAEVGRKDEARQSRKVELLHERRSVHARGRQLRLQMNRPVLAHQIERFDDGDALAEMDARVAREAQLVAGPGNGEVRQAQAVLVVVDARVAREQHATLRHGGVDAQMRPRPAEERVDARGAQRDLPGVDRVRNYAEIPVRRGERALQRPVDGERSRSEPISQPRGGHAQVELRIGRTRRTSHVRLEMCRARKRKRRLLANGADSSSDDSQIRRVE